MYLGCVGLSQFVLADGSVAVGVGGFDLQFCCTFVDNFFRRECKSTYDAVTMGRRRPDPKAKYCTPQGEPWPTTRKFEVDGALLETEVYAMRPAPEGRSVPVLFSHGPDMVVYLVDVSRKETLDAKAVHQFFAALTRYHGAYRWKCCDAVPIVRACQWSLRRRLISVMCR